MPIYEYYCQDCHTIYSFLSRRVDSAASPDCPVCGKAELPKMMSVFTTIDKNRKEGGDDPMAGLDEARMEQAFEGLMQEAENFNEDDPKQMASLMRKFTDKAGIGMGEKMEAALSRLEAGEDPNQVEKDMGDLLDGDDMFSLKRGKNKGTIRHQKPKKDEKLYFLK